MADSSLVTVERLTSTKRIQNRIDHSGRKHNVDTITIHCTAGNKNSIATATVDYWTNSGVNVSSQYIVGGDGSVCQNVLEADRAWTTGGLSATQMKNMGRNYETGSENDYHAITIEVSSNSSATEVTETALNKTIDLVTDICKRQGKTVAVWFGDNATKMVNYKPAAHEMKFTWHRWFAQKVCPGKFIMDHMQYIIDAVNSRLAGQSAPTNQPTPQPAPQPTDTKVYLENGDSGEYVKAMQNMLIECGYSCGSSGADGKFGSDTDKAVRAFQDAKNLNVDGLYGPKTKVTLEAECNKSELYKVRKSWEDPKSQIGEYKVLDNAAKQCDKNPGYSVYDSNGKCVYTTKKSNEEVAKEVIQGKWGNGTERKQRLTDAGYNYSTIQKIVNQLLK